MKIRARHSQSVCVGTGLIALDMVINGDIHQPRFWAGGSCGNVLTILSYLGWMSYPIARLKDNHITTEVLQDMEIWGVQTHLISRNSDGSTPVIVERIVNNRYGMPRHYFETNCPYCGSRLPQYKPLRIQDADRVIGDMPMPQIFYFDRVNNSAIRLAKVSKELGALIVFEPSGVKDKDLFIECLRLSDIVKYSHERIRNARELLDLVNIPLEIKTLGSAGLQYRLNTSWKICTNWTFIEAYPVKNLKDAAGSGDWCSAGIMHLLGNEGIKSFENSDVQDIEMALKFGQALAALNCYYDGARGGMYSVSKESFEKLVYCIQNSISPLKLIEDNKIEQTTKYTCAFAANESFMLCSKDSKLFCI